jgi:hypothetical protein
VQPRNEDEAWKAIVDNYGERPVLEGADTDEPAEPSPAAEQVEEPEPDEPHELVESEDPFVPPDPGPFPFPAPDRGLAWLGVFGAPAVLLFAVITGLRLPEWTGWLLVAAFIGGFCYLVFSMPRTPREPWDDGAEV